MVLLDDALLSGGSDSFPSFWLVYQWEIHKSRHSHHPYPSHMFHIIHNSLAKSRLFLVPVRKGTHQDVGEDSSCWTLVNWQFHTELVVGAGMPQNRLVAG